MSQKKRGLGRGLGELGLGELLGEVNTASITAPLIEGMSNDAVPATTLKRVPVDKIKPGRYQPRKAFPQEQLEELASSIKSQGIIQPIVLRHMNDGYEIIAGERRWRASQLAGLDTIPAIVKDIPDEAAVAMSLIENIQRQDLNVIEESMALQRLISEFNLTHQEVADAVGKSRAAVTNLLRLQKLNVDVRVLVEEGKLEMGHARALLALESFEQSDVAKKVVARELTVRQTEALIREMQQGKPEKTASAAAQDPNILHLQNNLSEKLNASVAIQHGSKGKGKLVIRYNSVDELEGILDHIS